ncbi:MAG: hypothetical protein Q7T36_16000 [Fluviicoccus sp.]|uniref:hypothetical protein n=1 Tax=Fluviicoccus sp. TaxID=2003552 RepID=UPI002716B7C7|nr:hypothetical protein [Fluviicoccus sp.]MDO8331968.1 hypothetical protein [Fluviicoccus sp.]
MKRLVIWVLAVNIGILALLVFVYPQLMVSPGKLVPAHHALETDCFACHTPFLGAQADRCMSCHKPADIGRLTSTGAPLAKPLSPIPFHQKLISQDCMACHSDHTGVRRFRQQGRFNHALLQPQTLQQCQTCHTAPRDNLHRQISGSCNQCHTQERWTPATFDHNRYFVLDRDHNVPCATCHVRNNYRTYTCYGCHEHTPANIRNEHEEEGIRNFEDCAECHRGADEGDRRGGEGGGEGDD